MDAAEDRDHKLQQALVNSALALERAENALAKQVENHKMLTEIRDTLAVVFAKHAGYDDTAWERVMKTTLASEQGKAFGDALLRKAFILGAIAAIGTTLANSFNILEKLSK